MTKLRLDLDAIEVESFPTAAVVVDGGTVRAHGGTLVGASCPAQVCQTYDDTLCGLTRGC